MYPDHRPIPESILRCNSLERVLVALQLQAHIERIKHQRERDARDTPPPPDPE